jgi:hypothetical protein
MNCAQICEHLPEFIDETLSATLQALDAQPEAEPSPRLRENLLASIEEEKRALRAGLRRPAGQPSRMRPWIWRTCLQGLAACVLLAFGFLAGVRRASAPAQPAADSTARQLAELNSRVDSMGRLVSYTLLQQQKSSANDRLEGVLTSATLQRPTENVIDNLVSTLVLDPSVNCRLNAVEALYAHADSDVVRTAIRVSLPREQSPLVQLAMIDFLAAVRDRDAAPAFQKLSASALADPSVRVAAGRALTQL